MATRPRSRCGRVRPERRQRWVVGVGTVDVTGHRLVDDENRHQAGDQHEHRQSDGERARRAFSRLVLELGVEHAEPEPRQTLADCVVELRTDVPIGASDDEDPVRVGDLRLGTRDRTPASRTRWGRIGRSHPRVHGEHRPTRSCNCGPSGPWSKVLGSPASNCCCWSGVKVSSVRTLPTSTPVCCTATSLTATSSTRSTAGIRPEHAVGRDSSAQRVVLRHVEGHLRVGTRDRGDVDDQSAARLDLRQLADPFDGGVVVAVVTRRAGAGGVHHHAVVVGAGLLPEPVEAAGRAPCAGEGGDGDREAEAGDDREYDQREVPPSPVGTHPHADRVAHAPAPDHAGSVTGGRSGPQSCYRRLVSGGRHRLQIPDDVDSIGLSEHRPGHGGRRRDRVQTHARQRIEADDRRPPRPRPARGACRGRRAVRPRTSGAAWRWRAGCRTGRDSANAAGSRLAAEIITITKSPRSMSAPPSTSCRALRSGRSAPPTVRAATTRRSRFAISDRSPDDRPPLAGLGEQMCEQVGNHALGGLDPAEQQHAGVGDDLVEGQRLACIGEHSVTGVDRPATPAASASTADSGLSWWCPRRRSR